MTEEIPDTWFSQPKPIHINKDGSVPGLLYSGKFDDDGFPIMDYIESDEE